MYNFPKVEKNDFLDAFLHANRFVLPKDIRKNIITRELNKPMQSKLKLEIVNDSYYSNDKTKITIETDNVETIIREIVNRSDINVIGKFLDELLHEKGYYEEETTDCAPEVNPNERVFATSTEDIATYYRDLLMNSTDKKEKNDIDDESK